jgi:TRAP transporter TAXI family solute receptor
MHRMLKVLASVLVALALVMLVAYFALAPKVLTIAVGPIGGSDLRVSVAFLQALQRERASIRLKLVPTESSAASALAFQQNKVQLAVLRTDVAMPDQAATVAVFRRDAVYFITRPGADIRRISDLRGKVVGLVAPRPANEDVLERVLNHYSLKSADLMLVRRPLPEIMQAVHEARVDAVFIVAPSSDKFGRQVFQAFPRAEDKEPGILAISEADAIVEQYPFLDTTELVRGAFASDPPRPDEELDTLAVTHRLVARRTLDDNLVAELTRLLMSLRLGMAAEAPAANDIELPSTEDRGAKLPTHSGTIAYAEGETKTFFERYGDWFYIGAMVLSLLGSATAAAWSRAGGKSMTDRIDRDMKQVAQLIEAARNAQHLEELSGIDQEADQLYTAMIAALVTAKADADRVATIRFLVSELRAVLADRRRSLTA